MDKFKTGPKGSVEKRGWRKQTFPLCWCNAYQDKTAGPWSNVVHQPPPLPSVAPLSNEPIAIRKLIKIVRTLTNPHPVSVHRHLKLLDTRCHHIKFKVIQENIVKLILMHLKRNTYNGIWLYLIKQRFSLISIEEGLTNDPRPSRNGTRAGNKNQIVYFRRGNTVPVPQRITLKCININPPSSEVDVVVVVMNP